MLKPLAEVIGGRVVPYGRVTGSYERFAVEAHPWKGSPTQLAPGGGTGAVDPAGTAHMLRLTLTGVEGETMWRCRSSPSSRAHDLASAFTAGPLLGRFGVGEFRFADWDEPQALGLGKLGGKLAGLAARELSAQLGTPDLGNTPEHLQQALIAAGLFEELSALRWGPHPYLPMAEFRPPASQLAHAYTQSAVFARIEPQLTERLRAAGLPDAESVIEQRRAELDEKTPGQLRLDVQMTKKARVPPPKQFRELLDRAVRIAQINREANPPTSRAPR